MEVPANSRVSRWSEAPPSSQPSAAAAQDADDGEKRPPPTAPEPPFKKSRIDSGQTQGGSANAGYANDAASGLGGAFEGLNSNRSAFAGSGHGASSTNQGFGSSSAYGGERSYAPGSARGSGTGALFFKTKLCTKFKLGSCTFNERCHFAHGVEELRKPPPGWEEMVKQGGVAFNMGPSGRSSEAPRRSNKPCRFYLEGHCPYGERCTFSHGTEDIQREVAPPMDSLSAASAPGRSNYKTRMCARWEKGELCIFGDKCHFAHGQAELRPYSGNLNYNSSGGTVTSVYNDPGMVNPPPMAAPYGAPTTYGSANVPPSASSANLNPYPAVGTNISTYGAQPDGSNGYSTHYPYWSQENKWDGSNQALPAPTVTVPMQGPVQPNQASWMPNYSAEGGYPKFNNNAAPYYNQDMPQQQLPPPQQQQQQQQQQHQQQQQNVPYYGNVPTYQDPNQAVNPPYIQDAAQNGDVNAYYGSTYANQQQGYTGNPQQGYTGNQQQGYAVSYNTV